MRIYVYVYTYLYPYVSTLHLCWSTFGHNSQRHSRFSHINAAAAAAAVQVLGSDEDTNKRIVFIELILGLIL